MDQARGLFMEERGHSLSILFIRGGNPQNVLWNIVRKIPLVFGPRLRIRCRQLLRSS